MVDRPCSHCGCKIMVKKKNTKEREGVSKILRKMVDASDCLIPKFEELISFFLGVCDSRNSCL